MPRLGSALPVLGTITSRPHLFADQIRKRRDVEVVEVNDKNRDQLPEDLVLRFRNVGL